MRTDEYPQAIAFMMNKAAFDGLSQANQDALVQAHGDAAAFARNEIFSGADAAIERLKALDGVTYSDRFDTGPIVAMTAELYAARTAAGKLPEGLMETVEAARQSAQ